MSLGDNINDVFLEVADDVKNKTSLFLTNNSGKIKLNWNTAERPSTGQGIQQNVNTPILLNSNYNISSSPITEYPYLADNIIGGDNLINPVTGYLRELKEGQSILFRVKAGYINKASNQTGTILLRMFNPNPLSSFEIIQEIPALNGLTSFEKEIYFIAIADSISLDSLFGYAFDSKVFFNDNNLEVYISNITAFYMPINIINK